VYSFERKSEATLPKEQAAKLDANAKAAVFFAAQPPWYKRAAIHWVLSAKRADTRERRLEQLIDSSAKGQTIPPLTRPKSRSGGTGS
jgi:uncharacterized protein YdeI (YjbR/CyaY-like superfamily)